MPASGIVPFFPRVREAGSRGVAVEFVDKLEIVDDEAADESLVVAVGEMLCDAVECDNEADCFENNPEISKRRRSFHVV